jgi:hypothetical protein
MNETPTITISFKFNEGDKSRAIESTLPYTGDFENLKQIVSEAQLMFYNLGYSHELVEQAVNESNIF